MDKAIALAMQLRDLRERVAAIVSTPTPLNGSDGLQGAVGASGKQGAKGEAGKEGKEGDKGAKGDTGAAGKQGISVVDARIDADNSLVISLSDGTEIDCGSDLFGNKSTVYNTTLAQGTATGTNTGDQTITLTGAATGSGTGTIAVTLANTAVVAGSYTNTSITVNSKGLVTAASSGNLRLSGYLVATLPAGVQGDVAFVTNALLPSYMVTVAGGGSVVTQVFYNGSSWICS